MAARSRASSSSSPGRSCLSGRSTTSSGCASPGIPTSFACSCPTTGRGTRSARTMRRPGCPSSSRKHRGPDEGDPVTLSPRDLVVGPEQWPESDETMIVNLGPQHPSTHGVLRVVLELEGETVLRAKPVIGYLHTGMEKTGETLTYVQGATNTTRMDYAAPLFNELVFSLATETLLGIENDIPERAQWIRMLLCELNRMSSHLLFLATNGMDLGAVSMMIYGWREREETLRLLEMITGLRMNHNFIRPGGVAADLPDGWRDAVLRVLDLVAPRLEEYEVLMTGQPIWRERLQGV